MGGTRSRRSRAPLENLARTLKPGCACSFVNEGETDRTQVRVTSRPAPVQPEPCRLVIESNF